jgi:hypothetical protein
MDRLILRVTNRGAAIKTALPDDHRPAFRTADAVSIGLAADTAEQFASGPTAEHGSPAIPEANELGHLGNSITNGGPNTAAGLALTRMLRASIERLCIRRHSIHRRHRGIFGWCSAIEPGPAAVGGINNGPTAVGGAAKISA